MRINSRKSDKIFRMLYEERIRSQTPVGWFQLYEENDLIYENHNLVVGQGREYVAQKINTITTLQGGSFDYSNYTLDHYAFGAGGATVSQESGFPPQYTLLGPDICDDSLSLPITFNINGFLDEPSMVVGSEDIYHYSKAVKPIFYPGGNNTYEFQIRDYPIENPSCSYYTQMVFTIFKEAGEFDLLGPGEAVPVSEAGLYVTNKSVGGSVAKLFARICFPPKFMEMEALYGIEWYILA